AAAPSRARSARARRRWAAHAARPGSRRPSPPRRAAAPPGARGRVVAGHGGGAGGGGAGAGAGTRARRARPRRRRARSRAMRWRGEAAFFRFFTNPRGQFPEDDENWKDSISTRKRFSVPGEDMRTSNGLEPRDGTAPKTKARPRLTTRPFSSSPPTLTITRSQAELAPLRTSP